MQEGMNSRESGPVPMIFKVQMLEVGISCRSTKIKSSNYSEMRVSWETRSYHQILENLKFNH